MGGIGSGTSWTRIRKATTEDYHRVDIRKWHRNGLLLPGTQFVHQWTLNWRVIGEMKVHAGADDVTFSYRRQEVDHCHRVQLSRTPCPFGGSRVWFFCPDCRRRSAVLYGGPRFICVRCRRVAYPSQRETAADRAARRAEKVRERFGWPPCFLDGAGGPPKGMHRRTYVRLLAKYDRAVEVCLADARGRFGEILDEVLQDL